jgi:hypothetical protein
MEPDVDEFCQAHRVMTCPLSPDSSTQIQALDLLMFGVMKRLISRINKMETVNVQSNHVTHVVSAFMSADSPLNVIGTFLTSGIAPRRGEYEKLSCRISPECV